MMITQGRNASVSGDFSPNLVLDLQSTPLPVNVMRNGTLTVVALAFKRDCGIRCCGGTISAQVKCHVDNQRYSRKFIMLCTSYSSAYAGRRLDIDKIDSCYMYVPVSFLFT